MMTYVECLEKAKQLDDHACTCVEETERYAYARTAEEWRRVAQMARQQEAWATLQSSL